VSFRPKVLVAKPDRGLRWLGHLWVPGLFDGEHSFVIGGALLPLLSNMLDGETRRGFVELNRALKLRCEAQKRQDGRSERGQSTRLMGDNQLERSAVVANCLMNRERSGRTDFRRSARQR
jgi:hypothetical protein